MGIFPKPGGFVDNLAAVDMRLAPDHVKLLDEASVLPAEYPGWMVEFQNTREVAPSASHRKG